MIKKILLTLSLLLIFTSSSIAATTDQIIVYYFYGKPRCITCKKIDDYTSDVVKSLNSKDIVYKTLDMDATENKAFKTKYKIFTKSVVLSKVKNNKEVKFKNLDKIFFKINNEEDFKEYLKTEIARFKK